MNDETRIWLEHLQKEKEKKRERTTASKKTTTTTTKTVHPLFRTNDQKVATTKPFVAKKQMTAKDELLPELSKLQCHYIGPKGYTLLKSELTEKEQEYIRKSLMAKPNVAKPGGNQQVEEFPVYRESPKKIIVPRYFGYQLYGTPSRSELPVGDKIDVPFAGGLRDYQINIINTYLDHVRKEDKMFGSEMGQVGGGAALLEIPCGRGKCLARGTPVMMATGKIVPVEGLRIGDKIMGDNGLPRTICSLAFGREKMYRIHCVQKDVDYTVNASHILTIYDSSAAGRNISKSGLRDLPVEEILCYLSFKKRFTRGGQKIYGTRMMTSVNITTTPFSKIRVVGDEDKKTDTDTNSRWESMCFSQTVIAPINQMDYVPAHHFLSHASNLTGHQKRVIYYKDSWQYGYTMISNLLEHGTEYYIYTIPDHYKYGSTTIRRNLMAGIIDGCCCNTTRILARWSVSRKCYELCFEYNHDKLFEDIKFVTRSLMLSFSIRQSLTGGHYYIRIRGFKDNLVDIIKPRIMTLNRQRIEHKKSLIGTYKKKLCNDPKYHLLYRLNITEDPAPEGDYFGFELDPRDTNRRFLLGDFTVTHNTVMGLNILSQLSLKTLVIVHKEFLMNQWIERIREFLPTARVGIIQGPHCQVEGNDICIGMLQSLSMKEYPAETFSGFGLTILDEVHHLGSEVFSRALFKICSRHMLGLSATMDRKDGLTKIFKMFLGPVIYKETRDADDPVVVYAVEYKVTGDRAFEKVILDYRGDPQLPSMITKLCDYIDRSEFILRVLQSMLELHPGQQIMILAQNKSLLTYLYEAITSRGIATTGYYVGGKKEAELKATESKQVVLATYSMASEALDIKTLASLIMATPRTDITQSVGRILRMKHKNPMIVDIIDQHDCFQRQWIKRRQFYKRQKYTIYHGDNSSYRGMSMGEWWRLEYKGSSVVSDDSDSGSDFESDSDSELQEEENSCQKKKGGFFGSGKCLITLS